MKVNYSKYIEVCKEAVKNDDVFKRFKAYPQYRRVLEHVSHKQGLEYLDEIKLNLIQSMPLFSTNDLIGKPRMFYYSAIHKDISPTTLRYIKVLSDLMTIFGKLDGLDIIEVGGGYGGQCKIIHDIAKPKSYTIVDLPDVLRLCKKYLEIHGIKNVIYKDYTDSFDCYDLFISNYAFTEIDKKYQMIYADNIIKRSDRGYMTCNFLGQRTSEESLSKEEILGLKDNHTVLQEKPLTALNNLIYTWQ